MGKVVFLGDTHLGVRNDSPLFMNHQRKFFYDVLFPYMKEHNIKRILQFGDLGDKRKGMSFNAKTFLDKLLLDSYTLCGATWDIYAGNHDQMYRNDASVTLQNTLLSNVHNVNVYSKPSQISYDGVVIDVFPWINTKDLESVKEFVKNSTSDYAAGHFEFKGFDMYAGVPANGGMSHTLFKNYTKVWSGHFHTQSEQDNVHYIGTPYDLTWADEPDTKGFHVFDTTTKETTFVPNHNKLHQKIVFSSAEDYSAFDFTLYTSKLVKLIIHDRTDADKLEQFLINLNAAEPANLQIVDTDFGVMTEDVDMDNLDVSDTLSILMEYVDNLDDDSVDKGIMKMQLSAIYEKATIMGNEL